MNEKKPRPAKKPRPVCMICGADRDTVREGELCLCARRLEAIAGALEGRG